MVICPIFSLYQLLLFSPDFDVSVINICFVFKIFFSDKYFFRVLFKKYLSVISMSFQYLFCDLYVLINAIFPWFLCMSYYYLSCFFKYFSCDKYLFCVFLIFITNEFLSHFMHQWQNVSRIFLCTCDKYLSRDFFIFIHDKYLSCILLLVTNKY